MTKNPDMDEPYKFVKDFCTPSTPHTVNIVTSVKKHKHRCCCSEKKLVLRIFLMVFFILSASGFGLMWFTNLYNDTLINNLVLRENSSAVDWWADPPLYSYLKIHIFNYTNLDDYFAKRTNKIILNDIGPYIYTEKLSKVDMVFNHENNTISYRERRTVHYVPELNTLDPDALVTVPNIPFISAAKMLQSANFFKELAISGAVKASNANLFTVQKATELIWGYEDSLFSLSKTAAAFSSQPIPFDKFGILVNRNKTSRDVANIHTGEGDINSLAKLMAFNGKTEIETWDEKECNEIDGTDGSQFPPEIVDKNHSLYIFIKDMCRSFSIDYIEDVNVFEGVPAWRYATSPDVFANSSVREKNKCYCPNGKCPPNGVFDAAKCNFDAPVYVSFPHFYTGDPELFEKFEGLNPVAKDHMTYVDIHPRLAFPIDGASRFQVNVGVHKTNAITSDLKYFEEGDILPVLWFELKPAEFSEELRSLIYHSSFSANAVQVGLQYGTIVIALTTFALLLATCFCCDSEHHHHHHQNDAEKSSMYYGTSKDMYFKPTTEMMNLPVTPNNSNC